MLWPLKQDVDFSFIMGRVLNQVAIGLYQVQFHFDDAVTISVEDSFTYERLDRKDSWKAGQLNVAGLTAELVGSVVKDVRANGSELQLTFANGHRLLIWAEPSPYESYQISYRGGLIVV